MATETSRSQYSNTVVRSLFRKDIIELKLVDTIPDLWEIQDSKLWKDLLNTNLTEQEINDLLEIIFYKDNKEKNTEKDIIQSALKEYLLISKASIENNNKLSEYLVISEDFESEKYKFFSTEENLIDISCIDYVTLKSQGLVSWSMPKNFEKLQQNIYNRFDGRSNSSILENVLDIDKKNHSQDDAKLITYCKNLWNIILELNDLRNLDERDFFKLGMHVWDQELSIIKVLDKVVERFRESANYIEALEDQNYLVVTNLEGNLDNLMAQVKGSTNYRVIFAGDWLPKFDEEERENPSFMTFLIVLIVLKYLHPEKYYIMKSYNEVTWEFQSARGRNIELFDSIENNLKLVSFFNYLSSGFKIGDHTLLLGGIPANFRNVNESEITSEVIDCLLSQLKKDNRNSRKQYSGYFPQPKLSYKISTEKGLCTPKVYNCENYKVICKIYLEGNGKYYYGNNEIKGVFTTQINKAAMKYHRYPFNSNSKISSPDKPVEAHQSDQTLKKLDLQVQILDRCISQTN